MNFLNTFQWTISTFIQTHALVNSSRRKNWRKFLIFVMTSVPENLQNTSLIGEQIIRLSRYLDLISVLTRAKLPKWMLWSYQRNFSEAGILSILFWISTGLAFSTSIMTCVLSYCRLHFQSWSQISI